MSEMKKFNKIKFLETVGLLDKRFNYKSLKFESSPYLRFKSYVILLYQMSFILKFFVSTFFQKEDIAQLWIGKFRKSWISNLGFQTFTLNHFLVHIGSPFNYLEEVPKFVMGLVVSVFLDEIINNQMIKCLSKLFLGTSCGKCLIFSVWLFSHKHNIR